MYSTYVPSIFTFTNQIFHLTIRFKEISGRNFLPPHIKPRQADLSFSTRRSDTDPLRHQLRPEVKLYFEQQEKTTSKLEAVSSQKLVYGFHT